MDSGLKKILRAVSLELRHVLEGRYDDQGCLLAGDLERRLNELGVWRDRPAKLLAELSHLSAEDKAARHVVDGYLRLREEAGVARTEAVAEFVREAAYTWANRLFALRCMEARGIIDEVILQKEAYGGRSMRHQRFARKNLEACTGEDDGLFAVLFTEFSERAKDLPVLFNPYAPAVALRPPVPALKRCIALLSGREAVRGQEPANDAVFEAPDAFGWAYQYWNAEEKDRVFEMVRTKKGAKIEGADIIPATCIYTEPYMVKFLVQNSLGALWMGMHPESKLYEGWEYYVKDADRAPVEKKPVAALTFLDPACGSGHFLLEAFDLLYSMYEEESELKEPSEICAAILNNNLFGIDIDERAVQIAEAALWMKAKEKAPDLDPTTLQNFRDHIVATNIRLPKGKDHLQAFLKNHQEDQPLRSALEAVFQGLENAHELGSLLQIEEPVEKELRYLKAKSEEKKGKLEQEVLFREIDQPKQGELPLGVESYEQWKAQTLVRLRSHFGDEAETADPVQAFFGHSAEKGLILFDLLSRRYDVVAANPPYMGSKNMGPVLRRYLADQFERAKRDLYAVFIARGLDQLRKDGRLAVVTPEGWCFIKAYFDFRKKIIEDYTIEILAFLGRHAFNDADPPGLPTLSIIQSCQPKDLHTIWSLRIQVPCDAAVQAQLLCERAHSSVDSFQTRQSSLMSTPNYGLFTWLPQEVLDSLSLLNPVSEFADCLVGIQTGDAPRYVRFHWETNTADKRWIPFAQGGATTKWAGLEWAVLDWRESGQALKSSPGCLWKGAHRFGEEALTYSESARGKIALRIMHPGGFSQAGSGVFPKNGVSRIGLAAFLSSRFTSYCARFLRPGRAFPVGYLSQIPVPKAIDKLERAAQVAVEFKTRICERDLTERKFLVHSTLNRNSLTEFISTQLNNFFSLAAILHSVEGIVEWQIFKILDFSKETVNRIILDLGTPVGWFPMINRYTATPLNANGGTNLIYETYFLEQEAFGTTPNILEVNEKLKLQIQAYFESGPGTLVNESDEDLLSQQDEEENLEEGSLILESSMIPPETFLEELSQRLEIHPVSIYWLLQEGIEKKGWRCIPEEQRITADFLTVAALRLLGHRWPKQIEAGEQIPDWADQDGIIPITGGSSEKILLERVRERIAEEFPGGTVASIEREFEEIVGTRLEKWLAGPFFKRHISQFKKRPIAWQIELGNRGHGLGARGKRKTAGYSSGPVFSCLVYYHKLDADLLPKIRSHYVGSLKSGYETELRALERIENPTADQSARKVQLTNWIDELKALDEKLSEVVVSGFGPESLQSQLRQFAIDDAMLALKARWLQKLVGVVREGPLERWKQAACETELHPEFPEWIHDALTHLDYHCSAVGPKAPEEKTLSHDPDSASLAALICRETESMVSDALTRACQTWWKQFDEAVIAPVRQQITELNEQIKRRKEERELVDLQTTPYRRVEIEREIEDLKDQVSALKDEQAQKVAAGQRVRAQIEGWTCPEAERWEPWLAAQPLYDHISSLDERRSPPRTVAEFIAQESAYAPDINDGVRVNIAPLQRAGLLPAEVIAKKDVDKAIADRAEWRADERRWCREGKLPYPGWWKKQQEEAPLTLEAAT